MIGLLVYILAMGLLTFSPHSNSIVIALCHVCLTKLFLSNQINRAHAETCLKYVVYNLVAISPIPLNFRRRKHYFVN